MLKTIQWTMLFDYERSPITGLVRKHWEEVFFTLLKGIIAYASEGKARVPLPGPQTRDKFADELEGFSRSFIMVGPWLRTSQTDTMTFAGETINVAGFYREGILAGTDPKHPEYWGNIVDRSQHLVECASLAWSLYLSQKHIWNKCSPAEKKQVANYLFQCTQAEYHLNNWLLFNVITNTVLKKLGMPYSQEQIDRNLRAVNEMYIGDGWYQDGLVNRIDYYNLWGFHYYHLMWVILDGESKPRIAKLHLNRMRILMKNFRYFFAGDGSTPCYGRSMIYRFAYLGPIALGLYLKSLIDLGEVKTICNATLKFFFDNEILTNFNHLSMGYLRPCPAILEHYSCGGSPYWAAKAFNLFLLSESDPFWQTIEKPLAIHTENFSIPIKSAGFLIVGDQKTGHVQLINQKSYHDKPGYRKKYTKFAYSSVFAYEASSKHNCDNALTCSFDGGVKFRQRWQIENLYCQQDFGASRYKIYNIDDEVDRYKLYEADDMGWGYTYILVKDDFMVNVHRIETDKSLMFREGGYPLGFDEGEAEVISTEGAEAAYKDGKISFLRNLYGYTVQFPASPLYEGSQGSNIRYRHSIVPALGFENKDQKVFYLASMIYGKIGHASIEELMGLVRDFHIEDGLVMVTFYDSEKVVMQLGDIRNLALKLNGKRISGKVIMARVSADGEKSFILQETLKVPAFLSQSFRRLLQRC